MAVFIRVVKLPAATFSYIGRVDTLFLHDGVGKLEWFGFRLDIEPYVFTMDIGLLLQREAHHHPVTCTAKSLCSVTGISFNHSHFFY
jgi:hypothetical protein